MRGLLVVCLVVRVAAAESKAPAHLAAYKDDTKAAAIAKALYDDYGDIATVGAEEHMDGGYRGPIHLVPELPIRQYRAQLEWVAAAMTELDAFFTAFPSKPSYRWTKLTFQFVRSIKKRTPSAY